MAIPVHNVAYYLGDTYTLLANFYKPDGTPIVLADGELKSWIVSDLDLPTSSHVADWSIEFNTTPNQAILRIESDTFTGEDVTIPYFYDVQFVDADNYVTTFFRGQITIETGVTETPDLVTP